MHLELKPNAQDKSSRPRVLLVDDVPANLVALEALLADLDCELIRATSGNEALKQLLRGGYAVLLLDVQMPDMDGYEVARYARANPSTSDVPIIFLTGMLETEVVTKRGYGSGAVDFLFKPIDGDILQSKVRVFLELAAGRRRLADEIESHKRTMSDLEAFNYSVSHDLRAPTRAIAGFARILLEDYRDLDATAREHLERIEAAGVRMGQLIDDLLHLSRLRSEAVERQDVDLGAVGRRIVEDLRATDPGRTVDVVICETSVFADPKLIRIALENILRNAWKFTRTEPRARISLGERSEKGERIFFVRDNGVGFDPSQASRLFKPFQRLHTEGQFEGTGIGLAIVSQIVRSHGGWTKIESQPGEGTTLSFTLE